MSKSLYVENSTLWVLVVGKNLSSSVEARNTTYSLC